MGHGSNSDGDIARTLGEDIVRSLNLPVIGHGSTTLFDFLALRHGSTKAFNMRTWFDRSLKTWFEHSRFQMGLLGQELTLNEDQLY